MKKKIIALRGRGSCGKTHSIGHLHEKLKNKFTLVETTFIDTKWDFISLFDICGIIVGLSSKGDTYDDVMGDLNSLINKGAKFLVCACRTHDRRNNEGIIRGSNTAINSLSGYTAIRINKTISVIESDENENALNNEFDAERLFKVIVKQVRES